MRTLKAKMARVAVVAGFLAGSAGAGLVATAGAQPPPGDGLLETAASDELAGYIVFPKIIVDTSGILGDPTDTLVQLSNTNLFEPAPVVCHWVNATSHCGLPLPEQICPTGPPCDSNLDCPRGLQCIPCWSETNFEFQLTTGQPIGFRASTGDVLPCFGITPPAGCAFPGEQFGGVSNVPENPFRGELKCYQTTTYDGVAPGIPAGRNDLKGEATIITSTPDSLRTSAYNAIGFTTSTAEAEEGTNQTDPLCLGGIEGPLDDPCGVGECAKVYAGCPGVLILNHFFDGARAPFNPLVRVNTDLTLVPCSQSVFGDLSTQGLTVVQFLIYNEFESRFSASTRVQCWKQTRLADIDTRPGPADDRFSIFSAGVQGTLTGQTRIRGVEGEETTTGHGLIGVADELYVEIETGNVLETAAFNLNMTGTRVQGDAVCR